MVVFLEVSIIATEELWSSVKVTIGFLGTTLSLGGSKWLPFKNDGGHCVLWDLQCCRYYLIPFPRSVPRHNPVSELFQFLFCSDMDCQLWDLI